MAKPRRGRRARDQEIRRGCLYVYSDLLNNRPTVIMPQSKLAERIVAHVLASELGKEECISKSESITMGTEQRRNGLALDEDESEKSVMMKKRRGQTGMVASGQLSKSKTMRAVQTMKIDGSIHPIVRMGWKSLCSVVCNGVYGSFYGGHDRDVFVQCTSPPYAGLPLVDVSYGGCMMTCSHFERIAGRELSKKWKESIHVVGQGEGSRSTMLGWLKRMSAKMYGASVVGKRVWVCWCADAKYYQGTIVGYNPSTGKHLVQYSPSVTEELHLPMEKIDFGMTEPSMPSIQDLSSIEEGLKINTRNIPPSTPTNGPFGQSDGKMVPNPIWNQGSDVSVNTASVELELGQHPLDVDPASSNKKMSRIRHLQDEELAAPKRSRSAPASVLQQLAALACQHARLEEQCVEEKYKANELSPNETRYIHEVSPENNIAIPLPPEYRTEGGSVQDRHKSVQWLHRLALALENDLQECYAHVSPFTEDTDVVSDAYNSAKLSLCSNFQALVALSTPEQSEGMFIALVERYHFFAGNSGVCRLKLAECILSMLEQRSNSNPESDLGHKNFNKYGAFKRQEDASMEDA